MVESLVHHFLSWFCLFLSKLIELRVFFNLFLKENSTHDFAPAEELTESSWEDILEKYVVLFEQKHSGRPFPFWNETFEGVVQSFLQNVKDELNIASVDIFISFSLNIVSSIVDFYDDFRIS